MQQRNLKPPAGATHKRKRVGRGDGSGHGSYSGRGCKGQKSRSGGGVRLGFEGGQLALIKRLPRKRGFVNIFKTEYSIVNVGELKAFSHNAEVTPKELLDIGLIKSFKYPVKILGDGDIDRPLVVKANKFSAAAEKKIVAAGGKVEAI
ncbi:MAG: 50S ribosomal protein L15 [Dehalococcoidia bacterium]